MTPATELPIGFELPGWRPPPFPIAEAMIGRYCRLEPLALRHSASLFRAFAEDTAGRIWTYLAIGPFPDEAAFTQWLGECSESSDPQFYAILLAGEPVGIASYLRIAPEHGSIEVGHIIYSPRLQRTPAATEAMVLLMARAFELGYRRYEWKCNALNAASRAAAIRLGFQFEGLFRQATVVKSRNRDTAWFSILDKEWPALKRAFEQWLSPENFDDQGQQRQRLSELTSRCHSAIT